MKRELIAHFIVCVSYIKYAISFYIKTLTRTVIRELISLQSIVEKKLKLTDDSQSISRQKLFHEIVIVHYPPN